jgi:hypothetical protein
MTYSIGDKLKTTDHKPARQATVQLIDVIHGSSTGAKATLITINVNFTPLRVSHRIRSATITLRLADSKSRAECNPEIINIALNGRRELVRI